MKKVSYIGIVVACVGVATGSTVWAQTPPPPTILYGTTTPLAPTNEFAVATTLPTRESFRAQYVVVAEANDSTHLEVLAWHDTTSSLESLSKHGTSEHKGVVSVAVTGLDACRVVTADINKEGVLSIHTWKVGPEGVESQRGYRTAAATAAQDVAIATVSRDEVVTAYETPENNLVVEAWKIGEDGLPAPKAVIGSGPNAFEVSVATIGPHQVVTASGDSKQGLSVNTWEIDSAGVKPLDQVQTPNALSTVCFVAPRPQKVAVGAGRAFQISSGSTPHTDFVRAAFTPVITPSCQLQVYYWNVSSSGALTLQSTTTPTEAGDFGEVAASMLPENIPITSYTGGIGDDYVFIEQYLGFNLLDQSAASYGDPYNAINVASAPAGTDFSYLSLFAPYNAYLISAGQFNPEEGVQDGTLFITVLSYPEAPLL